MSTDQESKDTRTSQDSQQSKPGTISKPAKKPPRRPRFEEQHPIQAAKALQTFASTGSTEQAAITAGCHVTTIQNMIRRSDGLLAIKNALANKAAELAARAQERAIEKVSDLNGMQAAVVAKMSGQSVVELTQTAQPIAIQVNVLGQAVRSLQELTSSADTVLDALPDEVPQSQVVSEPAK